MLSKARQTLTRTIFGSNLAGDGMLVRLRSTSIALLGVVTAIGLGLVAFIAQLGWPGIVNSPIPSGPAEAGSIHGAIALTRERVVAPPSPRQVHSPRSGAAAPPRVDAVSAPVTAHSGLGSPEQIGVAAAGQPPKAAAQPQPAVVPVSAPTVEPVRATPAPTTLAAPVAAVVETPQSSSVTPAEDPKPVKSGVDPPSNDPSTAKVGGNGEGESSGPAPEKPQCDEAEQAEDGSAPSTPTEEPPGKSEVAEIPPPVVVVPPVAPQEKADQDVTGYGTGDEAWDAGGSGKRHH
jgi:hypothetical protein